MIAIFTLWHFWICMFYWHDIFSNEKNLHLPVTWVLHWHWPVFWSQLGAPAEVLMAPTSLQLQRMQPFEFEALRPYQPGKQFSHWRPVTATLHWHWPPTCRWETRTQKKKKKKQGLWVSKVIQKSKTEVTMVDQVFSRGPERIWRCCWLFQQYYIRMVDTR